MNIARLCGVGHFSSIFAVASFCILSSLSPSFAEAKSTGRTSIANDRNAEEPVIDGSSTDACRASLKRMIEYRGESIGGPVNEGWLNRGAITAQRLLRENAVEYWHRWRNISEWAEWVQRASCKEWAGLTAEQVTLTPQKDYPSEVKIAK